MSKTRIIALLIAGALLFAAVAVDYFPRVSAPVACTMEAKLCHDGSYVGRTGPRCEFSPCPAAGAEAGWETYRDAARGISFKYPKRLSTTYINAFDWPPQVAMLEGSFACTEVGEEGARAGQTALRMVDDRPYCVTSVAGAAAGSRYVQYAYAFPYQGRTAIFTFSLRFPECANYEGLQQDACEGERETFDMDGIVDRMARTLSRP